MRDTVNKKYSNQIHHLSRLCLRECIGKEFTLMGFIHKQYDDGIRVLLVTDEGYLIRIPKWYSFDFVNCSDLTLDIIKSGNLKITNIRKEYTVNSEFYTYKFDLIDKSSSVTTVIMGE